MIFPRLIARADSIRNGADDDGSGTVSVLEIAEYFAKMPAAKRPKRSLLFVWHVGEENGLWGSRYVTDHSPVPRENIVAQLNMDMVGRGEVSDLPVGNPNYVQLVGSHRLSTELGDLVEKLNKAGVPAGPIYKMDEMFADPQVQHLKMAYPVKHPKLGEQKVIGQAINMSRTRVENWTATPEQGEHTDSILKEFGYDAGAIDGFRARVHEITTREGFR